MKRIFSRKNRALLAELVRTDFKLRYQGSVLGYAWTLLRPLFIFLILYFVFVNFLHIGRGIPHYPILLLLGIVLWNFFVETTSQSLSSIVDRGDLIRKISIPRWIIVLSSSISAMINLALNLVVVAIFAAINHVDVPSTIFVLPLILLEIYVFALGVAFFLASVYVKFRDIKYIWEVLLQAGFYATPIIYPISRIPNLAVQKVLLLSPMSQSIESARYHVVSHDVVTTSSIFHGGLYMYIPFAMVLFVIVLGVTYFRKRSRYFAEDI